MFIADKDWIRQQQQFIDRKQRSAQMAASNDDFARTETAFRYWMADSDGHLYSPFYYGARWTNPTARSVCALDRCQTAPGPCGWCGITVVRDAHAFAKFLAAPSSIPRKLAARTRRVRVAGVVSAVDVVPTLPAGRWNSPNLPEHRAAAIRIERLHVSLRDAHLASALSARYNVPVSAGLNAAALTAPIIQEAIASEH